MSRCALSFWAHGFFDSRLAVVRVWSADLLHCIISCWLASLHHLLHHSDVPWHASCPVLWHLICHASCAVLWHAWYIMWCKSWDMTWCNVSHHTSCAITCIIPSSHVSSSHVSWLWSKHDMHHRWELYISLVSGISLVRCYLWYICSERYFCMPATNLSLCARAGCVDG